MPPREPSDDSAGPAESAVPIVAWRDVQAVVDGALDLVPNERAAYLDRACGADVALREHAARLLDACERAARSGGLLAAPAAAFAAPVVAQVAERDAARADERRSRLADALRAALSGRYDIERELGRGGMATVFLAHDHRHHRRVALKVLDPALLDALSGERFLREIRFTAALTHPHVLPLHDSGEAAGLLYYVMPYVEGETLRARLARDGALPLADATRLIRELADALAHAHGRDVIHRDLKPENVLLAGGHAVVADFGIARAVRHARDTRDPGRAPDAPGATATLTEVGTSLGTPAYMAPEQVVGDAAVDHRADLYALGVVAYEVLAGTHPFGGRTPQALVAAHLTETPAPLTTRRNDVPPDLAALVGRLLAKDPADRPPSAEAVLHALDGVPATPATVAPARRWAVLASAALLLALGAGAYAVWRRAPARAAEGAGAAPLIRSVAVLPFANTSGDRQDDFFSDGLTDELAHALGTLPGLRLAGRTASYAFKGKAVAAQEVGRTLGVDAFVSATVRRSGDRLRVNPQLVSAADGKVLWDSVYESRSGDVFAVQDSLTRAVVAALLPALGTRGVADARADGGGRSVVVDVGRGTRDGEAYEIYLKGMYYWHERGASNVARSIGLFQQAIGRDPTFARAYAALSSAYAVLGVYVPDPADSTTPLIKASALRAVTLDSTLADAQLAIASALARDYRFADAEAHFRAALRIEPSNQSAHHALGGMLVNVGRTGDAIDELREATRLDPLAKSAGTMLAEAFIDARRFPEAENEARRVLAIDSTFPLGIFSLGLAQALGGQPDSAVRTLERGVQLYPTLVMLHGRLLFAYAAAGRWADAERMRAELRRPGGDHTGGILPAFADLVLGDRAPLLRLLTTRAGQRQWFDMLRPTAVGAGCNPLVDPLWADAGYRAAMRNLGVAPCPQARPWSLPPRPGTLSRDRTSDRLRK
ncbi:MAG TPA: protein kinase [Gemmatimonadaceae bacterium]|nr:protein kinase [Gemmatimonadaceae bacterium]